MLTSRQNRGFGLIYLFLIAIVGNLQVCTFSSFQTPQIVYYFGCERYPPVDYTNTKAMCAKKKGFPFDNIL